MDLALTRPSDDAVTRRVRAYVRCPWTVERTAGNVLAPQPVDDLVAWLNGEEPAPSRTRPAGMAGWTPTERPAARPRRRGFVRRLADRLGMTVDLYRQRIRRHLAQGAGRSRRQGWGGAA